MRGEPWSLRFWLAILFGGFAVALVGAFGVFVEREATARLLDSQERQLAQAAMQMTRSLDEDMAEHFREIIVAASTVPLEAAGPDDTRRFLERITGKLPNFAWIGLTDRDGRVTAATGGLLVGVDVSGREWFQAGRHGPAVLDVHPAKLLQSLLAPYAPTPLRFVDLAAPVYDRNHVLQGVLAGHLNWTWADKLRDSILASVGGLEGVDVFVVSKAGTIVLGPHDSFGLPYDLSKAAGAGPVRFLRTDEAIAAIQETRGAGEYPGLGWTVVAELPVQAAFAPAKAIEVHPVSTGHRP